MEKATIRKFFYLSSTVSCILFINFFLFFSCQKEESEPPNQLPACKIISPSNNETISFGSSFTISITASDNDGTIKGISLLINNAEVKSFQASPYSYDINTIDFSPGSYIIKAIATDDDNDIASNSVTITIEALLPNVETKTISELKTDNMSIDVACTIVSNGGDEIVNAGICWSEATSPTINDNKIDVDNKTGDYSISLTNLKYGKNYYVRAFASNGVGTSYGQELSFSIPAIKPTIITKDVVNVGDQSAETGGAITSDGGADIIEKGIVWSNSTNPTLNDFSMQDQANSTEFDVVIENLIPNTTHYVRAYAKNEIGIAYGNQIEFKTEIGLPMLNNVNFTNVTTTSITLESSIANNGGSAIIEKGFVWSETQNPSINNNRLISSSSGNSFTSGLENLKPNAVYYIKAFASNSKGAGYSEEVDIRTKEILQASEWLNYDDNEFEDGLYTPIPGYKFAVRFNVPQEFGEKYTVKKVRAYLYPFNPFGETLYDIEIHTNFTSKKDVLGNPFLAPEGNYNTIKNNVKQMNVGWNETSVSHTIDNENSFLVALELKSERTFGVVADLKNKVVNPIRSLVYVSGNKSWIAVNDIHFAIRVYIEDEYDNTSNGRWVEGMVIGESNSTASISSKSFTLEELQLFLGSN